MNNKKGFTLIELLAVIVILAVIALIVTPIVTGIIKSAKEQADRRSAEGYVKAAENYYASTLLDQTKKDKLGTNIFSELDVSSKTATKGNVVVDTNGNILVSLVINNKCYSKEYNQDLSKMTVSNDITNCGSGSGALVGTAIGQTVLTAFPQLELGTSGCKTSTATNYSYMNGCYLKGAQDANYLWYSGFLWRIMGINSDGTVRLITEENVTSIPYNVDNNTNFEGSHANSWLNDYFYNNLRDTDIIASNNFCQGAMTTSLSSARIDCTGGTTLNKKVGLISIDEYNLASAGSSYLNIDQYFWTMSPYSSSHALSVYFDGNADYFDVSITIGLRAVINVNSNSTITGGNGTLSSTWTNESSPYILNENKNTSITGLLNNIATPGEYVKLANKTYRVVSVDSSGNTKLILDGYYQEPAGANYTMAYGTDNTFTTSSGIGQKLNTSVLDWLIPSSDTTNRNKLVTNYTWYQNNFDYGTSYTVSLNETTPTRSIQATVGLIRMGEMLSGQSYTILTKNGTVASSWNNAIDYWTMSPYSSSHAWIVYEYGNADCTDVSNTGGLRAVINVNSNSTITSGNGTPSSPYEI